MRQHFDVNCRGLSSEGYHGGGDRQTADHSGHETLLIPRASGARGYDETLGFSVTMQVETIQRHDLGPDLGEIVHELGLGVVRGIDFCCRTQFRARTEDQID